MRGLFDFAQPRYSKLAITVSVPTPCTEYEIPISWSLKVNANPAHVRLVKAYVPTTMNPLDEQGNTLGFSDIQPIKVDLMGYYGYASSPMAPRLRLTSNPDQMMFGTYTVFIILIFK